MILGLNDRYIQLQIIEDLPSNSDVQRALRDHNRLPIKISRLRYLGQGCDQPARRRNIGCDREGDVLLPFGGIDR